MFNRIVLCCMSVKGALLGHMCISFCLCLLLGTPSSCVESFRDLATVTNGCRTSVGFKLLTVPKSRSLCVSTSRV